MNISEVVMIGAHYAYECCNNGNNLKICNYASSPDSIWGKFERKISGDRIRHKELGYKVEIFCLALGAFLKHFYDFFLKEQDSTKASCLILYAWEHFPKIKNEIFVQESTPTVRLCMNTREYMFFKPPYDSDKLKAFLEDTIWYVDSGSVNMDSEFARNIGSMINRITVEAYNKANNLLRMHQIVDDIGFTKATSETLKY